MQLLLVSALGKCPVSWEFHSLNLRAYCAVWTTSNLPRLTLLTLGRLISGSACWCPSGYSTSDGKVATSHGPFCPQQPVKLVKLGSELDANIVEILVEHEFEPLYFSVSKRLKVPPVFGSISLRDISHDRSVFHSYYRSLLLCMLSNKSVHYPSQPNFDFI
jgi:hypothetical protein